MRHVPKRVLLAIVCVAATPPALAQLTDQTQTPNTERAGIYKSLDQQTGAGVGDDLTPGSSTYIIARDPARSIRRGRQLFQRKFTMAQGFGPRTNDGIGDIETNGAHGAALVDSCAGCHGRPRGAAGFGGDVVTRPDSRDAPHLFGLGLKQMLAEEMTTELRATRDRALSAARRSNTTRTLRLRAKNVDFGLITVAPDGSVDSRGVRGVDPDLRVKPFFAHGGTTTIREFVVGAFNDEMGLQAVDPLLVSAANGGRVTTPTGTVIDGATDAVKPPPAWSPMDDPDSDGVRHEIPASLVDHMEFYLFNYFKPATYRETSLSKVGLFVMKQIGCTSCHVQNLTVDRDRRVADVETRYDPARGVFNGLFATAALQLSEKTDRTGYPTRKQPNNAPFVVRNFFSDLKRHDLGPRFHERNYDGSMTTEFVTTPLWGVGSSAPYGHDGRSVNLREVILRHGGAAQASRDAFESLSNLAELAVLEYLNTLVLFPPDDTASNLNPGNPQATGYPQRGQGSINLSVLFNDPTDLE